MGIVGCDNQVPPEEPRISFGMIVLNGEPFVRYNLRAIYPFAYEIIVVEGAAPGARGVATSDGHSKDGTLETLYRFKVEEDSDDKVHIITRDGFWSEKDEMSQAYAERATGNYLWQIDSDEFYHADDMRTISDLLAADPTITAVSFRMITFWGSLDYVTDGWYLRRGANIFHRVFKWGDGYRYITHRPPTVLNAEGRDTRELHWVDGKTLMKRGIEMHHYSLLLPKQVYEKCVYYGNTFPNVSGGLNWSQENFMNLQKPFRVHNVYRYPSWLERFTGHHPEQVGKMWEDLHSTDTNIALRHTDDIEHLLSSTWYPLMRICVKYLDCLARVYRYSEKTLVRVYRALKRILKRTGIH